MYYIEDSIRFVQGIHEFNLGFHRINQIRVDYINTEVELQIASYESKEAFKNSEMAKKITAFMINFDLTDYNIDPNLFALRLLISQPGLFYKKEIKKVYDMSKEW